MKTTVEKSSSKLRKSSRLLFVIVYASWLLLLLLIAPSIVHDSIQTYISDPVLFRVRHMLGKTPPISDKLRIFALDNGTMSFLKKKDLSIEDLTLLLENIARQKPKAILLDALFTNPPDEVEGARFLDRLRHITEVPIYTGAFTATEEISYRAAHILEEEKYGLQHWVQGDLQKAQQFIRSNLHRAEGRLYASDEAFKGSFTGVGDIHLDKVGSLYPFIFYQDKFLLPNLALYAADSVQIEQRLLINGKKVPIDDDGGVTVNHRPKEMFFDSKTMKPLRYAITRARNEEAETWVKEGDVVVILFNFLTGSTDFVEGAPFGDIPGGLMISTLADSIIENNWLTPVGFAPGLFLILVMSALGIGIARRTGPIQFWGVLLLFSAASFAAVNYLFTYHGIVVSWVLPLASLIGGGIIQYIYNRLGSEWKAVELENQFLHERALRLEEEATKIQLAERLNLGRAVQEILLPSHKEQTFGPFRYSMSYLPAQEMSGDWIYLWSTGEGERRVFLGDVVGKGPSAAIPVAVIIGVLGECERLSMSMSDTLQRLNDRIIELFDRHITCSCAAIVLQDDGSIELYNAGSPGWVLKSGDKSRYIPLRSSALGLGKETQFSREKIELNATAMLFTFTDGYMEGGRALRRLIQGVDQLKGQPELSELTALIDDIGKDFRLDDDRSLLLIHTDGKALHKAEPVAS